MAKREEDLWELWSPSSPTCLELWAGDADQKCLCLALGNSTQLALSAQVKSSAVTQTGGEELPVSPSTAPCGESWHNWTNWDGL